MVKPQTLGTCDFLPGGNETEVSSLKFQPHLVLLKVFGLDPKFSLRSLISFLRASVAFLESRVSKLRQF